MRRNITLVAVFAAAVFALMLAGGATLRWAIGGTLIIILFVPTALLALMLQDAILEVAFSGLEKIWEKLRGLRRKES